MNGISNVSNSSTVNQGVLTAQQISQPATGQMQGVQVQKTADPKESPMAKPKVSAAVKQDVVGGGVGVDFGKTGAKVEGKAGSAGVETGGRVGVDGKVTAGADLKDLK